jgi:hypothetical protein
MTDNFKILSVEFQSYVDQLSQKLAVIRAEVAAIPQIHTSWKSACDTVIESQFGNGTVNNNLENISIAVNT